ncbi:putative diaminobutyrate--2-oxoglutarate transaminase [Clostridium sp. CAG:793]|jgi:diaminobutyrate-2-oxoglutarate transaminase|nr:putative diaminobutyrate--2-oxoglutarate transaminase [Clostridium sp. CAG:793]
MNETFEKYESNIRSYCRKWPVEFVSAKGSIYKDTEGNEYIDFFDGAGALNYGHNPDYIKEKLIKYLESDGIVHALDMYTVPKENFINYFEEKILKPRKLDYKIAFPGPTGTNSIELALKLARKVKQRPYIWAFTGAFHGMTLGALALTTESAARKAAGVPLNYTVHIPAPYSMGGNFDSIAYMEQLLSDDHSGYEKPAAIIIETVQQEGGIHVFSKEFLKDLRALCDKYDILLICDEVQIGCSRSGTFFSFERADIVPDIVCMSKSIGGYGIPFAVTLFKKELDVFKPGEHNGTFRGCQLSMVAGLAALEMTVEQDIPAQVRRKEKIVKEYLDKEIKPLLKGKMEIRGIGLSWGIEFNDGKLARAVLDKCFEKKLIIELAGSYDSVLKIMPSLVIEDELLLKGLNIVKESIQEVIG